MVASIKKTKICQMCAKVRPLTEFRRRYRNRSVRLNQCRLCHNQYQRERRKAKRDKDNRRQVASVLTKIVNEDDVGRLKLIGDLIISEFGGLNGFAEALKKYCQHAMEVGGFPAFRCLMATVKISVICEQGARKKAKDREVALGMMSNEELDMALAAEIERVGNGVDSRES